MHRAQRIRHCDGKTEKLAQLQRRTEQAVERFSAAVFQQKDYPSLVRHQVKGTNRPGFVQRITQVVFVFDPLVAARRRRVIDRNRGENRLTRSVGGFTFPSKIEASAILPSCLEGFCPMGVHSREWPGLHRSASTPEPLGPRSAPAYKIVFPYT